MRIFVYVTPECRKEANEHGWSDALDKLSSRITSTQSISFFDRFPQPYLVKKKFAEYNGRLIAAEYGPIDVSVNGARESCLVVVFLCAMIRGDKNYGSQHGFIKDTENFGKTHLLPRIRPAEINDYVQKQMIAPQPDPVPALDEFEQNYLDAAVGEPIANEVMIAESKQWIEKINLKDILACLQSVHEALSLVVNQGADRIGEVQTFPVIEPHVVHYQWVSESKLYLCDITSSDKTTSVRAIPGDKLSEAERFFYREYPAYLLAEYKMWSALEGDPAGNYALSPEEEQIIHPSGSGTISFPLFINGRAGSGKSTILQYIYAEYLARFIVHFILQGRDLTSTKIRPPAYFACSADLIENAKNLTTSILNHNASFGEDVKNYIMEHGNDSSFYVYRDFLLQLIPSEERDRFFQKQAYIGYSQFIRKWEDRFGKTPEARRDYGPDISWHVIRSYIKGMSIDDVMEEDEYALLPKNQKSVSESTFKKVYQSVWANWYKGLTEITEDGREFWDDQDLARYVLENDLIGEQTTNFLGVFCDEAQDFTHLELESFLRMSLFSRRKVYPHQVSKIPFIFAGDEFQTLNPTGFRWESVKAAFVEKFILGICPTAKTANFNLKDLRNNYRSLGDIVRFGNSIQLLRSVKFNIKDLLPQEEWQEEVGNDIVFFKDDDNVFWDAIAAREDAHVIVPCLENGELEYIDQDPVLKRYIQVNKSNGTTLPPVLSASRAKGLEYQCVVVYGFGKVLSDDALLNFDDIPTEEGDRARFLHLEYFMNRLYVAVSRPRNQLYIVDSPEGIKKLWRFAQSPASLNLIRCQLKDRQAKMWEKSLEVLITGTADHLLQKGEFDAKRQAEDWERNGRSNCDPVAMEYAAHFYTLVKGCAVNVGKCQAFAFLYKNQYKEAAEKFKGVHLNDDAAECYWKLANEDGWKEMVSFGTDVFSASSRPQNSNEHPFLNLKVQASAAIVGEDHPRLLDVIAEICKGVNSDAQEFLLPEWKKAIQKLVDIAWERNAAFEVTQFTMLKLLISKGIVPSSIDYARFAFEKEEYCLARAFYDALPQTQEKEKDECYYQTYFHTTDYPDNLQYLQRIHADFDNEVIDAFNDYPHITLSGPLQKEIVARAFIRKGKASSIRTLLESIRDEPAYRRLSEVAQSPLRKLLVAAAEVAQFERAVLTSDGAIPELFEKNIQNRLANELLVRISARLPVELSERRTGLRWPSKALKELCGRFLESWENSGQSQALYPMAPKEEVGIFLEKFGRYVEQISFYESIVSVEWDKSYAIGLCRARYNYIQFLQKEERPNKLKIEGEIVSLQANLKGAGITLQELKDKYLNLPSLPWEDLYSDLFFGLLLDVRHSSAVSPVHNIEKDHPRVVETAGASKPQEPSHIISVEQSKQRDDSNTIYSEPKVQSDGSLTPPSPTPKASQGELATVKPPSEPSDEENAQVSIPATKMDTRQDAEILPEAEMIQNPLAESTSKQSPSDPDSMSQDAGSPAASSPTIDEKPSSDPVEKSSASIVMSSPSTAPDIPGKLPHVSMRFFAKTGKLRVEDDETGDEWTVDSEGISSGGVDGILRECDILGLHVKSTRQRIELSDNSRFSLVINLPTAVFDLGKVAEA